MIHTRALYVPIREDALEKLGKLARAERRHPKDTAALLLETAIEDATSQTEKPATYAGSYPVSE